MAISEVNLSKQSTDELVKSINTSALFLGEKIEKQTSVIKELSKTSNKFTTSDMFKNLQSNISNIFTNVAKSFTAPFRNIGNAFSSAFSRFKMTFSNLNPFKGLSTLKDKFRQY